MLLLVPLQTEGNLSLSKMRDSILQLLTCELQKNIYIHSSKYKIQQETHEHLYAFMHTHEHTYKSLTHMQCTCMHAWSQATQSDLFTS